MSYLRENSVAAKYPELISEWDNESNGKLKPEMFFTTSPTKVYWICSNCGERYKAEIRYRCAGHGCKKCGHIIGAEKKIKTHAQKTPFGLMNPEAAKDWDYEKNVPYTPFDFSYASHHPAFWRCHKCGHTWQAPISRRIESGCERCGRKKAIKKQRQYRIEKNGSLQDQFPSIAAEWDQEKNGDLTPSMVTAKTDDKAWWICSEGHPSYYASIGNRTILNRGCPICGRIRGAQKRKETIKNKNKTI